MQDKINLDYETKSEIDIACGTDRYSSHPSTKILMAAWSVNNGPVQQWDAVYQPKMPAELREALQDPHVHKHAFNATFERLITTRVAKIQTPYSVWRCTMALAYMMGFAFNLEKIGEQMQLKMEHLKDKHGKALIKMFSCPQRVTKNQPNRWRDPFTNPTEWEEFLEYNRQDVVAEMAVEKHLIKFPVLESEWSIYHLDQEINDRGIYLDERLITQAISLAETHKESLINQMRTLTGLANPSSPAQLQEWLNARGYPFPDIGKDTVVKVIKESKNGIHKVPDEVIKALKLRQASGRTSTSKYNKMLELAGDDGFLRHQLQYYGAQRTGRFAGRGVQLHNLPRTMKLLENVLYLEMANKAIHDGDLDMLGLLVGEPLDAIVSCVRSAFIPRPGYKFVVADLSSIESVVIGWLTDCEWFLDTLKQGRDLYRAFAEVWLRIPYDETKPHRSKAKPATLGAGYRLGGGEISTSGKNKGKKTGLWGYAENMGVELTRQESHSSVKAFRDLCPEITQCWKDLENAAKKAVRTRSTVKCGKVTFEYRKPFLCIILPSGRRTYYFNPRIRQREFTYGDKKGVSDTLTYMGRVEGQQKWGEIDTHGGKLIENIVQAIARDILTTGMLRAREDGFEIPLHVHDEIVTEVPLDNTTHNVERLIGHMTAPIWWAPGLPLGAAGWEGMFYRKD